MATPNTTVSLHKPSYGWRISAILVFIVFAGGFVVVALNNSAAFDLNLVPKPYRSVMWATVAGKGGC